MEEFNLRCGLNHSSYVGLLMRRKIWHLRICLLVVKRCYLLFNCSVVLNNPVIRFNYAPSCYIMSYQINETLWITITIKPFIIFITRWYPNSACITCVELLCNSSKRMNIYCLNLQDAIIIMIHRNINKL